MMLRFRLYFLTLVLAVFCGRTPVFANPHTAAPEPQEAKEDPGGPPPEAFTNDRLSITPVAQPGNMTEYSRTFSKSDYYYPYRQTLTPRAGVIFGLRDSSGEDDLMNLLLGFNYLLPRESSPHYELGADLSLGNLGFVNVMKRFIYNERGSFRPYYKYGVTHKFVPDERFASFSNWENYLARGSVGFEDILRPPRSLRLELEAAVGTEDIFVMFTYGYSFGW